MNAKPTERSGLLRMLPAALLLSILPLGPLAAQSDLLAPLAAQSDQPAPPAAQTAQQPAPPSGQLPLPTEPPPKTPTEPAGQRAGQAAAQTAGRPVGPPVAPDNSLAADAYKAKGFPAIDKPWTDVEYLAAARALEAILTADPTQLPRYGSPTSGPVFARIVAVENFAPLQMKRTSADQRLNQAGRYGNAIQQIMNIYARALNQQKKTYDAELVELSALNLELADRLRMAADQLVSEVAGNDPQHDAREQARDRTYYSFVAVIDGALAALPQHQAYRTDELVRYSGRLAEVIPRLYPVLPANAKRDLPARLQKLADEEKDPALKGAIQGIKDKLK